MILAQNNLRRGDLYAALTTNFNFIKNYEGDGFGMLHSQTNEW